MSAIILEDVNFSVKFAQHWLSNKVIFSDVDQGIVGDNSTKHG